MNKLDCKVGEIWLNCQNQEVKILYVDDYRILSEYVTHPECTSIYNRDGKNRDYVNNYNLSHKKPEIVSVPYCLHFALMRDSLSNLYMGQVVKYTDSAVLTPPANHSFVKWVQVAGKAEVEVY